MKKLFKQMQKEQMKIIKDGNKKDKNKKPQTTKGFIANCLVKVICSEQKAVTPDMLKVYSSIIKLIQIVLSFRRCAHSMDL